MEESQKKLSNYLKYLELDPKNILLCIQIGDLYHESGSFAEARRYFERAREQEPENSIVLSRLGNVSLSENNFESAAQIYSQAIKIAGDDKFLKYNYAISLYYCKRFSEAHEVLSSLPGANGGFPEIEFYRVSCLHNQGRLAEAIEHAEQSLSIKRDAKLMGYLSLIRMDSFDMASAIKDATAVLEMDSGNADAATVLGNHAIEEQDISKAKELFELVVEREPGNPRGWQGKGLASLLSQDYEGAQTYFERAVEISPDQVGNFNTLGWTHIIRNNFHKAEQIFRSGIEKNRNNAEVHGGLSVALAFQNKLDEAKQESDIALKLDRSSFGGLYAKSIMLKLKGKDNIATKLLGGMLDAPLGDGAPSLMDHLIKYEKNNSQIRN